MMRRELLTGGLAALACASEADMGLGGFGSEARARQHVWYEENSPGQRKVVQSSDFPIPANLGDTLPANQVPVLEVRDFGAPMAITLQLDKEIVQQGASMPAKAYGLRARIAYGCGGASDYFECDWAEGGLVNLVAQRLTVTVSGFQIDPVLPFLMGDDVVALSASVGHEHAGGIHPFYTVPWEANAGASSPRVTPPAWARACSVFAISDGSIDPYGATSAMVVNVTRSNFLPMAQFYGYSLAAGAAFPIASDQGVSVANGGPNRMSGSWVFHIGA